MAPKEIVADTRTDSIADSSTELSGGRKKFNVKEIEL
jgi:hypothetical protein